MKHFQAILITIIATALVVAAVSIKSIRPPSGNLSPKRTQISSSASSVTFTNTKYAYIINYPSSKSLYGDDLGKPMVSQLVSIGLMRIYIYSDNPERKLIDIVENEHKNNSPESQPQVSNQSVGAVKETTIDGEKAYEYLVTGSISYAKNAALIKETYKMIFVNKDGHTYMLAFPATDNEYKQMITSFKFIN